MTGVTPESHRIRIINNIIWYDIWKGVSTQRLRDDDVLEYLLDDLSNAGLSTKDIKNYSWIVNTGWEGHSAEDIEHFRILLLRYGLPTTRFGAVFIASEDVDKLPYPAESLKERMIYIHTGGANGGWYGNLKKQQVDWKNLPMTHKFTILMRRASTSRAHIAKRLLDQFPQTDMIMSLGTSPDTDLNQYKHIIFPYSYPIFVDNIVPDNENQHNFLTTEFYRAPVQVVVESSSDIDDNSWLSQFITEKSYKAFCWHQLPLWHTVKGFVSTLRNEGFDVFDDIINHNYDAEVDPWVRMELLLEELQRLCKTDTVSLRKQVWSRLESNAALVEQIHTNARKTHKVQTNRLVDEIQQLYKSTPST